MLTHLSQALASVDESCKEHIPRRGQPWKLSRFCTCDAMCVTCNGGTRWLSKIVQKIKCATVIIDVLQSRMRSRSPECQCDEDGGKILHVAGGVRHHFWWKLQMLLLLLRLLCWYPDSPICHLQLFLLLPRHEQRRD